MVDSQSHLFVYEKLVQSFCSKFLAAHNLAFFGFVRVFEKSECIILSTHPKVYQFILENHYGLNAPVPERYISEKFYYLVPMSQGYQEVMHFVASNFNLFKPFDIFYRYPGYYELFCFGANHDDPELINLYINKLVEFEIFCKNFKERFYKIISEISKAAIKLQKETFNHVSTLILPSFKSQILKSKIFHENAGKLYAEMDLSKRQAECLHLLREGRTAKHIGQKLGLSHRTVEKHLEWVRIKLGCINKSQIIELLNART